MTDTTIAQIAEEEFGRILSDVALVDPAKMAQSAVDRVQTMNHTETRLGFEDPPLTQAQKQVFWDFLLESVKRANSECSDMASKQFLAGDLSDAQRSNAQSIHLDQVMEAIYRQMEVLRIF